MEESKFEQDLERLERVVEALEEGGLSLDDALSKFEEGIKLSNRCSKALDAAEKKIETLVRNASGELETAPFEDAAADNHDAEEEEDEDSDDEEDELLF